MHWLCTLSLFPVLYPSSYSNSYRSIQIFRKIYKKRKDPAATVVSIVTGAILNTTVLPLQHSLFPPCKPTFGSSCPHSSGNGSSQSACLHISGAGCSWAAKLKSAALLPGALWWQSSLWGVTPRQLLAEHLHIHQVVLWNTTVWFPWLYAGDVPHCYTSLHIFCLQKKSGCQINAFHRKRNFTEKKHVLHTFKEVLLACT